MPLPALRFTTLQAPNQDFIIQELCSYVGTQLGVPTEFIIEPPWQERERQLDSGEVEIAWICGLPYVWRADQPDPAVELLVAPVMLGERYQNMPVYFSDVIVRKQSIYQNFEDLRGVRWAYNEPHSHSGYNLTCYSLARLKAPQDFFGVAIQAGSHQRCIEMLLQNQVDAAAIDSTVLEIELDKDMHLGQQLRKVAVMGPSPIPPLVISKRVDPRLRAKIRKLLTRIHEDPEGQRILQAGNIKQFVTVKNKDYDLIRKMAEEAKGVRLSDREFIV